MSFSDAALEILKRSADYAGAHEQSVIVYPDELDALIARLEAAERVCMGCECPTREVAIEAWRKAAGK